MPNYKTPTVLEVMEELVRRVPGNEFWDVMCQLNVLDKKGEIITNSDDLRNWFKVRL